MPAWMWGLLLPASLCCGWSSLPGSFSRGEMGIAGKQQKEGKMWWANEQTQSLTGTAFFFPKGLLQSTWRLCPNLPRRGHFQWKVRMFHTTGAMSWPLTVVTAGVHLLLLTEFDTLGLKLNWSKHTYMVVIGSANYCSCTVQCAAQVLNVQSKKKYFFFQKTSICVWIFFLFL